MANSQEFLALIRVALEGAEAAVGKLKQVQQSTEDLSTSISANNPRIAWLQNIQPQADTAKSAIVNFDKELQGFVSTGQKLNTVWKDGEPVAARSVETFRNQAGALKQVTTQFDNNGKVVGQSLQEIYKGASQSAGIIDQLGLAMRRALIVAPVWMIMRAAIQGTMQVISSSIKFLIDLESAMTRIKIVGKGTEEEFRLLGATITALGVVYGVSASDAIAAAVTFAQQGRTVAETIELTKVAVIGAKVLGTDLKTTVDNLTAAIQGFQVPISNAIDIVDKWINVERQFAVTAKDLADATKATAATANQMGITISEFLGDVTAVIEVTRKSGAEAARGLSFLYARLTTTARSTIEQIAKIPFYLTKSGEATFALTGELRPFSAILEDLANKWVDLSREEKLAIAASLGSKRQMVTVNALMQNYTRSIDARITSLISAGQSERALALELSTTTAKMQQAKSAWNLLATAVGDTSAFKAGLDIIKDIAIGLTYLIDKEKAYRVAVVEETASHQRVIDARKSEIASLQELIALRDRLNSQPITDKNTERLKTLNDAITKISVMTPELKIAVDSGSVKAITAEVDRITETLSEQEIKLKITEEFLPQRAKYIDELAEARTLGQSEIPIREKLAGLTARETAEIDKQITLFRARKLLTAVPPDLIDDEDIEQSSLLTESEKERIDIERQLLAFRLLQSSSTEDLIKKEIELTQAAQFTLDKHQKTVKLEELQTKLIESRVNLQEEKTKQLISHELELLKIRGASEDQITRTSLALESLLSSERGELGQLSRRLKLEEQITREKSNQANISSDALKLYDIYQKYGLETARSIGEFVANKITYSQLQQRNQAFDVFKQEYADWYKSIQAELILGIPFPGFGNVGGPRQYAPGSSIPLQEYEAMKQLKIPEISKIESKTTIQSLNVAVTAALNEKMSPTERATKITQDIAEAIRSDIEIQKAIAERIELF